MTTIKQIETELARLGLEEEFLCTLAGPPDDGTLVALADNQETTVFAAAGLLQALRACPADATWDDVWQAILPHQVPE